MPVGKRDAQLDGVLVRDHAAHVDAGLEDGYLVKVAIERVYVPEKKKPEPEPEAASEAE